MELSSEKKDILCETEELFALYAPGRRLRGGTADAALNELFCELTSHNRALFERLAERHRLLYLNMYGLERLPALPATGYVRVTPTAGGVTIKKGTRLGCDGDAEFVTETDLCAADTSVTEMFCTADGYVGACPDNRLFDISGRNLQETALYFSSEEILRSGGAFSCTVKLYDTGNKNQRGEAPLLRLDPSLLKWEYLDGQEAFPIAGAEYKDGGFALTFSDAVPVTEFHGISGRWIKLTFSQGEYPTFVSAETAKLSASLDSVAPQSMYYNDSMLPRADFLPFGEQPTEYDAFYIHSDDCFGKKRGRISIKLEFSFEEVTAYSEAAGEIQWKSIIPASRFAPKPPLRKKIEQSVWEYWNGRGWRRIFSDSAHSGDLADTESRTVTISFDCPEDMSETFAGADQGFFVRLRVNRITPGFAANVVNVVPRISTVALGYVCAERRADNVLGKRSLSLREADTAGFYLTDNERRGCRYTYFRFEDPLPVGYTNIYFRLCKSDFYADKIVWEALYDKNGDAEWKGVTVGDKTSSLSESGIITFGITEPMACSDLFSRSGYWLRACVNGAPCAAVLGGIYTNAVPVIQLEKQPPARFTVSPYEKAPELALASGGVFRLSVTQTQNGAAVQLRDKMYSSDEKRGLIRFDRGYEPPVGAEISAEYSLTRGAEGNVREGGIDRLLDPVPFIDEVTNPESAFGGRNAETFDECAERGRSRVRTLGRCVSARDCEEAAGFADKQVIRAKALSQAGRITLILLTESADTNAFVRTRKNVAEAVLPAMPFFMRGGLEIRQADYIEISAAVYVVSDREAFPQTLHAEITEKLRGYLDPVSGGSAGCGFEIGEYPRPEDIRALILSVPHVRSVTNLELLCRRGTAVFDYEAVSGYEFGVPTYGEPVICIDESRSVI